MGGRTAEFLACTGLGKAPNAKLWRFLAWVGPNRHRPTQRMSFGPPGGSGGVMGGPKMTPFSENGGRRLNLKKSF